MAGQTNYGIGINGIGRIGRLVLRRALDSNPSGALPVRAINSSYSAETIAHLLKYDSVHGKWNAHIETGEDRLIINGQEIVLSYERDPENIPWKDMGVRVVADATGKFTSREGASRHLNSGAEKVVVTAPGKEMDITVVIGVNDGDYRHDQHHLISTASCTTNCVAPVLQALDQSIGIEEGWVTTVHAFTSDQRHLDNPHKDLRRARACGESIVPTSTGIGKALAHVLPHLSQSIHGLSLRVPVPDVSICDMTLTMKRDVTVDDLRRAFVQSSLYGRILDVSDEPLVSSDYIGNPYSSIVDGLSLAVHGRQAKVLAWYDNEWGYACRVVDMLSLICESYSRSDRKNLQEVQG
jgi:glyceraldehyde 3-phosphate dehydrogenase